MPWMTMAPMPSGIFAKQSWIARIMPSFSALRLAGRLRPTDSTGPDLSTLSSAVGSAVAAGAACPMDYYVLSRIVIHYNDCEGSQSVSHDVVPANAGTHTALPSQLRQDG